jgi:hypothetical protein
LNFGKSAGSLTNLGKRTRQIELKPRLVTSDFAHETAGSDTRRRYRFTAGQVVSAPLKEGLIERVLSEWSGAKNILHLVYPTPRGMLPSVRSLIDYLLDPCSDVAGRKSI